MHVIEDIITMGNDLWTFEQRDFEVHVFTIFRCRNSSETLMQVECNGFGGLLYTYDKIYVHLINIWKAEYLLLNILHIAWCTVHACYTLNNIAYIWNAVQMYRKWKMTISYVKA